VDPHGFEGYLKIEVKRRSVKIKELQERCIIKAFQVDKSRKSTNLPPIHSVSHGPTTSAQQPTSNVASQPTYNDTDQPILHEPNAIDPFTHQPTTISNSPSQPTTIVNRNPVSVHPIVTRFRAGTNRLTERLNLHVSTISPLPKSYTDAFNDPNWQNAMCDEYNALIKNNTWTLVPRRTDANVVRCMWLFRHKYLADDTLSRYKARLVANGSTQLEGIDVDETFSQVVKS
ncbi:ribonuclease H-like domain-containing protein, partial [Tanacetum coccineum]